MVTISINHYQLTRKPAITFLRTAGPQRAERYTLIVSHGKSQALVDVIDLLVSWRVLPPDFFRPEGHQPFFHGIDGKIDLGKPCDWCLKP